MKKPISLDIILPTTLDLTPNQEVVERCDLGEIGYIENIEYTLQISFSNNSSNDDTTIFIDYYGEDDEFLSNIFDFNTVCDSNSFIQKQYEIANILGIKTLDM